MENLVSHVEISRGGIRLEGRRWNVENLDSIAFALRNERTRCGVYRLHFSTGEYYVGQSVNVITRFAAHKRRWKDIDTFEFYPVESTFLDDMEKLLITASEEEASIRNIIHANRPGGVDALSVHITEEESISLSWNRSEIVRSGDSNPSPEIQRYLDLARHEAYPMLHYIVGWYLHQTCPMWIGKMR